MSALIKVKELSKYYGVVVGLNNVSFEINEGITGLLGPNGAGKSTFMKLLTGQLKPTLGEITFKGQRIWNNPDIYRNVGFCPEQDSLHSYLTGFEFVVFMLQLQGYARKKAKLRAAEVMEIMDMTESMHRKTSTYSRGMRQRTKLAQAIAHDPELLILDEPLTGLDPVGRNFMINRVKDLGEQGKSVIISSHVLHEVESMTKDFLLINSGKILASGNIHDIRSLITQHPHRIVIECTPLIPLSQALVAGELVSGLELDHENNAISVLSKKPDEFYKALPGLLQETGTELNSVNSDDDNLDTVFRYLLGEDI